MHSSFYLIGIDGGGTRTRVVLADARGAPLARASAGPSGLALGIGHAWQAIEDGCRAAFASARLAAFAWSRCVLGCGLAGANHPAWLAAFHAQAPRVAGLSVHSDAYTTLLGAHGGAPGVVVALGTGSIAAALDAGGAGSVDGAGGADCVNDTDSVNNADGTYRVAGGLGFPSSDEASGAWLGLRAIAHAQHALDGRAPHDAFARALLAYTGAHDRESLIVWLGAANQTAYASLAPVVFAHRDHPFAAALLASAGAEIAKMIHALDPAGTLPVALCGGLGALLCEWVPAVVSDRLRAPLADSAQGALLLAQREAARICAA